MNGRFTQGQTARRCQGQTGSRSSDSSPLPSSPSLPSPPPRPPPSCSWEPSHFLNFRTTGKGLLGCCIQNCVCKKLHEDVKSTVMWTLVPSFCTFLGHIHFSLLSEVLYQRSDKQLILAFPGSKWSLMDFDGHVILLTLVFGYIVQEKSEKRY